MENGNLSVTLNLKNKDVQKKSKSRNKMNSISRKIQLKEIKKLYNSKNFNFNFEEEKKDSKNSNPNTHREKVNENKIIDSLIFKENIDSKSKANKKDKLIIVNQVNSNSLPKFSNAKLKSRNNLEYKQKFVNIERNEIINDKQTKLKIKSRNKFMNSKIKDTENENHNSNNVKNVDVDCKDKYKDLDECEYKFIYNKDKNKEINISQDKKQTNSFKSLIMHKVEEIIKIKALNSTKNKVHSRNIAKQKIDISKSFENKSNPNSNNNSFLFKSKIISKISENTCSNKDTSIKFIAKSGNEMNSNSGSLINRSKSFCEKREYIIGLEEILNDKMPMYRKRNLRNSKYKLLNLAHNILN